MPEKSTRLNMSMMLAMHHALRRDLANLAALAQHSDGDLAQRLRAAAGWQLFRDFLHVHHSAEDETLWPMLHESVQGSPAALEVLAAMEAEHQAIDPALAAIDAALRAEEDGPLRTLIAKLVQVVGEHLAHEEQEALPLIDATLTDEQWLRFGADHRAKVGSQTPRWMPWILDGALPEHTELILGRLPDEVRATYHEQWRPAYLGLNLWGSRDGAAVP
jgi:iron-sulfur cluster repair protein YtfE (RIC family)